MKTFLLIDLSESTYYIPAILSIKVKGDDYSETLCLCY